MDWGALAANVGKAGLTLLGGALGGPPGIAMAAGTLIADALGCDNEPQAIDAAISKDPEAFAKLRIVQDNNRTALQKATLSAGIAHHELEVEENSQYLGDMADARERDEKRTAAGKENTRANMMIAGDVIGLLACLIAMVWIGIQAYEEKNVGLMAVLGPIGTLSGVFGTGLTSAHQFEFGSSRGSKEKDARPAQDAGSIVARMVADRVGSKGAGG